MRKFLSLILTLLTVSMVGNAQVTSVNLGYCDGDVSRTVHSEFCSSEKDVWVSGAIWLPASDINVCAGNELRVIRAGLAQKISIDTMCVWVRETLDGANMAEGGIPKADIQKGWNEIALNTPMALDGNNTTGLYFGYSYHQTSVNQGMSVFLEPTPHALYLNLGEEGWVDRSDEGLLCVEGMVFGDNLPALNLRLASIDAPDYYVLDKGKMHLTGVVKNLGVKTVTGFDVEARIDGIDEVYTAHIDSVLEFQTMNLFEFDISPAITQLGEGRVTVTITKLNEGDDLNMADNVASDVYEVVEHDFSRMVLIEEFTTEKCVNCPRVAGFIHELLDNEAYKDVAVAICHHAGYDTDWLTIPSDYSYLWYYNDGGSTYCPAAMIDRSARGGSTPVFLPSSVEQLASLVNGRLVKPALVSVNVKAEVDEENNKVKVMVNGSRSKEDFTVNPARINVFLVENNIKPRAQSGATSDFMHQHVTRKVNSDWGEVIEWNGNDYYYEYTFDLRADYVRDNLQIVALIYDYDPNDAAKNEVANAGTLYYADFTSTGISAVQADTPSSTIYDLYGRVITHPTKGIYIVDGQKVIVK
ncbi:MAG: Omp28-related outer membrane protein [Prevotella sp.]|nr:Omp28-related outer membrane protein [Prevotella sp.]